MNLFGDVVGKLAGASSSGEGGQPLMAAILEMLGNHEGGVSGLAQAFAGKGLGNIVSSWIGTGANLPVSAEQITQVIGSEKIGAFAEKAGISPETASSKLADLLPGVVDKLTPNGEAPQQSDLMYTGMGLLGSLMPGFGQRS